MMAVGKKSEVKIYRLLPDSVEESAEFLRPFIQSALDNGLPAVSADNILADLIDDYLQCWCVVFAEEIRAIAITDVQIVGGRRELFVTALSGEGLDFYKEALDSVLTDFARACGCIAISSVSRRGMSRALRSLGYRENLVIMRKPLESILH